MKIPCISCQSLFRLDRRLVKATGSLVRCSKCKYIFMVYPPALGQEPVIKETNIDQSILFDLFEVEQMNVVKTLNNNKEMVNNHTLDQIASIDYFEEEEEEPELQIEDIEHTDLPDLSEYEDMIDWDDLSDADHLTESEKRLYNGTQDIDIN